MILTVRRPLNIGLKHEAFIAFLSGINSLATQKNPRKDRFFTKKRPLQARIRSLETGEFVLREIKSIEETLAEWRLFFW